jgi:KaiC/GvpD/RAD55 family RecA-like ATPase
MEKVKYSIQDFANVPSSKQAIKAKISAEEIPNIEQVRALAKWDEDLFEKVHRPAPTTANKFDRSSEMAYIAYRGAELGWQDSQIMSVLLDVDSRWKKYASRRDRDKILQDFVERARQKIGYTPLSDLSFAGLFSDEGGSVEMGQNSTVYGFGDFLETEYHIDWILDGLLQQGGLGLITGWPGTGKTTFCIQMGAYLATGKSKFMHWNNVGSAKKVLFLSLEMSAPPLHHFMTMISKSYEDTMTLNKNFLIAPLGTPRYLDTEPGQKFIASMLEEYMPDVLIIDSLQKVTSKELTDEVATKELMNFLSVIRQRFNVAVLFVHHNRKKGNDAQAKGVELSDVYGSVYITAEVDFVVNLKTKDTDLLEVDTLKNRLGPTLKPFEISRDENLTFSTELSGIFDGGKENGLAGSF